MGILDDHPDVEPVEGYTITSFLGQGGFGKVMEATNDLTDKPVAVKFVNMSDCKTGGDWDRIVTEVTALQALRHRNVVGMLDYFDTGKSICLIMEYVSGGELREYVENEGPLDESDARDFFGPICKAVRFCHNKNYVHRDLKLDNILLTQDNVPKIVDFGLSGLLTSAEGNVTDAGTLAYIAPEVLAGQSGQTDAFKIDVWALGVILYAMTQHKLPFTAPTKEALQMLAKRELDFPYPATDGFKNVLYHMLTRDVEKRASMNDILTSPWMEATYRSRASIVAAPDGGINLADSTVMSDSDNKKNVADFMGLNSGSSAGSRDSVSPDNKRQSNSNLRAGYSGDALKSRLSGGYSGGLKMERKQSKDIATGEGRANTAHGQPRGRRPRDDEAKEAKSPPPKSASMKDDAPASSPSGASKPKTAGSSRPSALRGNDIRKSTKEAGRPVFGGKKEEESSPSPKIQSTYGREGREHAREGRDRPWSQAGAKTAASSPPSGAKARPKTTPKSGAGSGASPTPKAAAPAPKAAPTEPSGTGTSKIAPRGAGPAPTGGSSPRTPRRRGTDKDSNPTSGAAAKKRP